MNLLAVSAMVRQVVLVVCYVIDLQPEIRQTPLLPLKRGNSYIDYLCESGAFSQSGSPYMKVDGFH